MYAEIVIPLHLPKNYTWKIPDFLMKQAGIGIRVEVELRRKKYTGIIVAINDTAPELFEAKDIISILDDYPIIYPTQLALWKWIADYYMCSQGDVMQVAMPSNLKLNSESILVFNEEYGDQFTDLGNDEYVVAEALHIKKELKISEIQKLIDSKKVFKVLKTLADKNICFIWESLKEKFVAKTENYVLLNPKYDNETELSALVNNWSKAPKQMELLLAYLHYLRTEGVVSKKDLLNKANATDAQLKGLLEKDILIIEKRSVNRIATLPLINNIDFELSPAQQEALTAIRTNFTLKKTTLLHGITGSGKTLLYIQLLSEIIKQGQQALYLLPEIALTAQLTKRLQQYFGGNIAVYHSRFSDNERVELWHKVRTSQVKIIIGARSSFLLPFKNLELIIVDEEHENTFKQFEPAPRYNAKDAAIYYASVNKINILLGTATPSVETFTLAKQGQYGLVQLNERFGEASLPNVEIIDMKLFPPVNKERVIISTPLANAISACLNNGKQVILFKNRRGYTPYRVCSACGWIPECKHCKISLTYHKNKNQLACNYCSTVYPLVNTCVACGNIHFEAKNFGTEKIEEAVIDMFPSAKVGRMDVDTVKGKNAHLNLIQQFEMKKLDILVGTQMLVKGLDFEHVQLVGILDADSMLNFADFRVNERAFQLMEQVSGRAGRKKEKGLVVVQANNIHHPIMPLLQAHDYNTFYTQEVESRKAFNYPPYSRLIHLQFKHKQQDVTQQAAYFFAKNIPSHLQPYIIGPAEPSINRLRNMYLMDMLFKLPKQATLINETKTAILQTMALMQNTQAYSRTIIVPNVDPV